jgi:hypothetical protein
LLIGFPAGCSAPSARLELDRDWDGEKTYFEGIALKGKLRDWSGLKKVEVRVNGRRVEKLSCDNLKGIASIVEGASIEKPGTPGRPLRVNYDNTEIRFSHNIPLEPGENRIEITSASADGSRLVKRFKVIRERVSGVLYAVVVGISKYRHVKAEGTGVRYAVRDAQSVAEHLRSLPIPPDRVKIRLLLNEEATLCRIKSAFGTDMPRAARRHDVIVFFFAGLGSTEIRDWSADERALREIGGMKEYFLPYDGDPEDLYATALPYDELGVMLRRIRSQRKLVFYDVSFSGKHRADDPRERALARGLKGFAEKRFFAEGAGKVEISACRYDQVALEEPELEGGLFTHYFLEGLRGKAEPNGAYIDVLDAFRYAADRVKERTGGRQTPVIDYKFSGLLPLGYVGKKR